MMKLRKRAGTPDAPSSLKSPALTSETFLGLDETISTPTVEIRIVSGVGKALFVLGQNKRLQAAILPQNRFLGPDEWFGIGKAKKIKNKRKRRWSRYPRNPFSSSSGVSWRSRP